MRYKIRDERCPYCGGSEFIKAMQVGQGGIIGIENDGVQRVDYTMLYAGVVEALREAMLEIPKNCSKEKTEELMIKE